MSELVCVRTYGFRPEAELAKSVLESSRIESVIVADDGGGMRPLGPLATGGVMLCVWEEDAERAARLLDDVADSAEPEAD
jgi:hypothetical protein